MRSSPTVNPAWLSALASAASAIAAAVTSLRTMRELGRWREQKSETKRAEVAGEVLVATLRFLTAVSGTASIFGKHGEDDEKQTGFRKEVAERWAATSDISNAFIKAWELAETYLPDAVNDLLGRVWQEKASLAASQMTFFQIVGHPMAAEFFNQGFGSDPEKRLAALRDEARRVLRPLAQLAEYKELPSAAAARQLDAGKR